MVQNLWKKIILVCGNCHEEEVLMQMVEGPLSPFYACPKYYPENLKEGERACYNRLNFVDLEKLVDFLSDKIEEALMHGQKICLTNVVWTYKKKIIFKVIEHTDSHIKVEVLNKKELK